MNKNISFTHTDPHNTHTHTHTHFIYIYIYIYIGKTGNRSDSMKVYGDEQHVLHKLILFGEILANVQRFGF